MKELTDQLAQLGGAAEKPVDPMTLRRAPPLFVSLQRRHSCGRFALSESGGGALRLPQGAEEEDRGDRGDPEGADRRA